MRIAIDAMGGDFAPQEIILGAIEAAQQYRCEIILVGDESIINPMLEQHPNWQDLKISVRHTTQVIEMTEHPGAAVRKKKDASVVVATSMLKHGLCDAVISAGHTGAAVAAALLGLGRIKGIERPAIATPIPNLSGTTVLLDSGANVDSKPRNLVQHAIMGSLYSEYIFGVDNPRVGLLNIGEEETKGNEQVLATYPLLQNSKTIRFVGNVEGRDITAGSVDVVVCDGFVGNIVLKTGEGLASAIMQLLKEAILRAGWFVKPAAFLLKPAFRDLKTKLDYAEYGGAPLLGVEGVFIICHGSSKAKAIKNAVRVAKEFAEKQVVEHIRENIAKEGPFTNAE